ncbi:MAG: hypothetical protein H7255_13750 [Ramlibacter sp.]|nr:hypothetical protein [Ramlibacter sp.]
MTTSVSEAKPKESASAKVPRSSKAKAKAPKPITMIPWRDMSTADCKDSVRHACHLSSRSVNSNAAGVGVRLAREDRLDIPFVGVGTLDTAFIPLDYVQGATSAPALRQITTALKGDHALYFTGVSPEQVLLAQSTRASIEAGGSTGTELVDPRLRQVIWPTGDDLAPWIALTPLQSSGLSALIRARERAESAASVDKDGKSTIYRANAVLGIGGANVQNVGVSSQIRSMNRPLVFLAPQESKSIRAAYALHFKGHFHGLAFAVPRPQTRAFALWRRDCINANGGTMPSNVDLRRQEADLIRAIAVEALRAATKACAVLEAHRDCFDELTSATMNPFLRALIDPSLRLRGFRREFAQKLISGIERFKYRVEGKDFVVCGDSELSALISVVEASVS